MPHNANSIPLDSTLNPLRTILGSPPPEPDWLIPALIPRDYLVTLIGLPSSGKSYLSYSLALSAAAGLSIFGATPRPPIRVVYFDQENSRPDRDAYLYELWQGLGAPAVDQLAETFWPLHFVLGGADWFEQAAHWITRLHPDLFIIDTATPACHILNEQDNGMAAAVIDGLRRLQRLQGSAALVLKHALESPWGSKTVRGAKAWIGAVDSCLFLSRDRGHPLTEGHHRSTLEAIKARKWGLKTPWHLAAVRAAGGGIFLQKT